MIVVDSSVWVDYFTGTISKQTNKLDTILGQEPVAIGDLILTEVLQGFRQNKDYNTASTLFDELIVFDMLGKNIAIKSAENCRVLRKKDVTICKMTNAIIASFCIERRLPLLFSDKDFKPFVDHLGLTEVR